jgi:hypothetical protein
LGAIEFGDGKRLTSNKDDHNLTCNDDELDPDEPFISVHALKYIKPVVDSARAATISVSRSGSIPIRG